MATSSSIPATVNYTITQGDTFAREIEIETTDDSPVPVDLSGATIVMTIADEQDLTEGDGLTVGGDDDNVITINKIITWAGKHKYALKATFGDGTVKTYHKGYIKSIAKVE